MKNKLAEYINTIFADAEAAHPNHRQLAELKEEMRQNLTEKYDDLIASGKSPAAAYNIAVSSIGDISALLASVTGPTRPTDSASQPSPAPQSPPVQARTLTPDEEARAQKYRNQSAIVTSVAVALYILCCVPCILLGNLGNGVAGVTLMFVMIAVATALLIFNSMTKPKFLRELDDDDDDDDDGRAAEKRHAKVPDGRPRRSPLYAAISGALWILTVCAYLLVSFLTSQWQITWMMFLIAVAVYNIVKAIFDLRR